VQTFAIKKTVRCYQALRERWADEAGACTSSATRPTC